VSFTSTTGKQFLKQRSELQLKKTAPRKRLRCPVRRPSLQVQSRFDGDGLGVDCDQLLARQNICRGLFLERFAIGLSSPLRRRVRAAWFKHSPKRRMIFDRPFIADSGARRGMLSTEESPRNAHHIDDSRRGHSQEFPRPWQHRKLGCPFGGFRTQTRSSTKLQHVLIAGDKRTPNRIPPQLCATTCR